MRLVTNRTALEQYLAAFPAGETVVLQHYVADPNEAGIFYVRHPDEPHGRITSLTIKQPPIVALGGKTLEARATEIAVQFKRAPAGLFQDTIDRPMSHNWLIMHLQPDEGISLEFGAKIPSPTVEIGPVEMIFSYHDYFGEAPRTGYETLLYDVMIGDQTLFQRADTVDAGWQIVQPILDVWAALTARDFPNYAPGDWGPPDADALLARDGHRWRDVKTPLPKSEPEGKRSP